MISPRLPRVAFALVILLLGCGDDTSQDPSGWVKGQRLIRSEPIRTFDRGSLYEHVVVFEHELGRGSDREAWKVRPEGAVTIRPNSLRFQGARPTPALVFPVDLMAEAVDAIEVDVAGLSNGPIRLFWRGPGQEFIARRGIRIVGDPLNGNEQVTLTFPVGEHDAWKGKIGRLRLDPTMTVGEIIDVAAIRCIKYLAPENFSADASTEAWRVDLDHELRSAVLVPPEHPLRFDLGNSAKRLRFGFGVSGPMRTALLFRVEIHDGSPESRTVFEGLIEPGSKESRQWNTAELDLEEALAGVTGRIQLEFSTEVVGQWDSSSGMPVVSNPELLGTPASTRPPNVLLISIDTLRADHLSAYGYSRRTSPRIDSWAERAAVVFEQAVVSAPWTLPSHVSMLSGLDADRHGINHGLPMSAGVPVISEYLRDAGYRTGAITGGGWMRPEFGFARGFDSYRYWPAKVDKEPELERGVAWAKEWLAESSEDPFFLFFHTFEVHSPHRRRQPYFSSFSKSEGIKRDSIITEKAAAVEGQGYLVSKSFFEVHPGQPPSPLDSGDLEEVIDRYDSAIAYTDDRLGELLTFLEDSGLAATTVVVITSDHGDAFGEKNLISHGYLYDFNLLVPLIIAGPGQRSGHRVTPQVRSVDIVPTIVDFVGLEPRTDLDGVSLRHLMAGETEDVARDAWSYAASSNRGIALRTAAQEKYILNNTPWAPLAGQQEHFDLHNDPGELESLDNPSDLVRLHDRAVERLQQRLPGLFVTIENMEPLPLLGKLSGGAGFDFRLKHLQIPGSTLEWQEYRPEVAQFSISSEGTGSFVIEAPNQETFILELRIGNGDSHRLILESSSNSEGAAPEVWGYRRSLPGWHRPQASSEHQGTLVTVRRRSTDEPRSSNPAEIDARLRSELRELGYVQ